MSGPASGTLVLNADGTFTYTPDANFNGTDSFVYQVTDGNGGTAQATVAITVGSVNDAPVAVDDTFVVDEDGVLNDELLSNDSDLDSDTLQVNTTPVAGPTNGTVDLAADGTFTYTPDANFFGTDSFTYEVNDGNGATDLATVTIDIEPVNDAPVIVRDNLISNGDFSNGLAGWTFAGRVVETDGAARFGGGNTPTDGVLSQTFATIPGETYEVSFDYDSTNQNREQTIQAISVDDGSSNLLGEVVASTSTVLGGTTNL